MGVDTKVCIAMLYLVSRRKLMQSHVVRMLAGKPKFALSGKLHCHQVEIQNCHFYRA